VISIFYLLSFFFFSSPNLSGRRLDVYHTYTHGVALCELRCRSETCCRRLAGNAGRKKVAKNRHLYMMKSRGPRTEPRGQRHKIS